MDIEQQQPVKTDAATTTKKAKAKGQGKYASEILHYEDCIPVPEPDPEIVECLDHSYKSYYSLGLNALSAFSLGSCLLSVLTINGVVSLMSCNSVVSILSLNSAFSILSTNSAFAIGCVDKRFAICW
jgi:hypothetical protein